MNEKNRKILIIVTVILLVLLVSVGVIMLLNQPDNKKDNTEGNNKVENNRCVEQLCISKISTEEENNSLSITLKNEGDTIINDTCVKLVSEITNIELCVDELEPNGEMLQMFEKTEMPGKDIEDFSLEKVEKKTTTE